MTFITWKERQANGSLFEKTLSLEAKNIVFEKRGWCFLPYFIYKREKKKHINKNI